MTTSMTTSTDTSANACETKMYCKVCQDAGKSESEYTSHFVRASPDPDSEVVCPTLLALTCRYCRKDGHTKKYCPVLASKNARRQDQRQDKVHVMNSTDHELYNKCLAHGISSGLLLIAFAAPRECTTRVINNETTTSNGYNALNFDDDEECTSGPAPVTTSPSSAEWSKMSHAGSVRRERELNELLCVALKANEEMVKEAKLMNDKHIQNIENIKQEFRRERENRTMSQIQAELDNAIAIEIESIERNSTVKKKTVCKRKHGSGNIALTIDTSVEKLTLASESMSPPPQVSVNISQPKEVVTTQMKSWGDECDSDNDDDDEFFG
jgi:hypothetical protein